jgi:hypothetical protein
VEEDEEEEEGEEEEEEAEEEEEEEEVPWNSLDCSSKALSRARFLRHHKK